MVQLARAVSLSVGWQMQPVLTIIGLHRQWVKVDTTEGDNSVYFFGTRATNSFGEFMPFFTSCSSISPVGGFLLSL